MALSEYANTNILNKGVYANHKNAPSANTKSGKDFDKRYEGGKSSTESKLSELKSIGDTLSNALGTRSPYYTIGEIQSTTVGQLASRYLPDALGNMVRAVTNVIDYFNGENQDGVIIDGFGTINGNIGVEFTKNPIIFSGSQITDGRMRTPNTVRMTVYVSNYYNDNIGGAVVDYLSGLAGEWAGLVENAANILLNNGNTRAQQALYNLRYLQEQGRPFTLYTPHGIYENMLIQTLAPRTTDKNVDMLECDITFMEMIMYEPYLNDVSSIPARTNIVKGSSFLNDVIDTSTNIGSALGDAGSWVGAKTKAAYKSVASLWGGSSAGTATAA